MGAEQGSSEPDKVREGSVIPVVCSDFPGLTSSGRGALGGTGGAWPLEGPTVTATSVPVGVLRPMCALSEVQFYPFLLGNMVFLKSVPLGLGRVVQERALQHALQGLGVLSDS